MLARVPGLFQWAEKCAFKNNLHILQVCPDNGLSQPVVGHIVFLVDLQLGSAKLLTAAQMLENMMFG